jgi:hypothetical protein
MTCLRERLAGSVLRPPPTLSSDHSYPDSGLEPRPFRAFFVSISAIKSYSLPVHSAKIAIQNPSLQASSAPRQPLPSYDSIRSVPARALSRSSTFIAGPLPIEI